MAQDCSNFEKNGTKWTFRRSIEVAKRGSNCKLTLGKNDDQLLELNRRSYNEHMGSETFINLLDGEREIGTESRKENIKSLNVVSNVLHSGGEELHINEERCRCFCVPSRYLIHKGSKSLCLNSSLGGHVSMDVVSQSEFASQTLKAYSTQNLEWIAVEEREIRNGHTKYKLKESTPGCLPSKGKSKKLQRKMNGRLNPEELTDGTRTDPNCNERRDLTDSVENNYGGPNKATRSKSFLSSLKFIKLGKFGRKKKSKGDLCEACDHSNWDTESAESSEERRGDTDNPYQDDEFVFGGVRVFIDENGECYEIDEELESTVSSNSSFSDDESRCSNGVNCARTKFESRDSLNLGYSGSFVT